MKYVALIFCFIVSTISHSQVADTVRIVGDTTGLPEVSTGSHLLHDDPIYNPKAPAWKPALRVLSANVFNWAVNRYFFKVEWTASSIDDWKNNFKLGPEWDRDGFGTNFIGHPHTGTYYFNVARSNGYTFWQGLPFTIGGSLIWEYLGENERPSYNDMLTTTVGGMHLGEVLYRVTSNILDDRKKGAARVWREAVSTIINPTRSINRFTSGKMFRVTEKEVYQKAPMDVTFTLGAHRSNAFEEGGQFSSGRTRIIANLQLDYGDLFAPLKKKPFDFFRFRVEMRSGGSEKNLSIVESYGLLAGKIIRTNRLFGGLFQHFDYWRSNPFELGSVGYGGSLLARYALGKNSKLHSNYHLNAIPLAAYHVITNFDDNPDRTYNFSGGLQAKIEQELSLAHRLHLGFSGSVYWVGVYKGLPGTGFLQLFKPYIALRLGKIQVGAEHQIFNDNRYRKGMEYHRTRTEQRFFLRYVLEDEQWMK